MLEVFDNCKFKSIILHKFKTLMFTKFLIQSENLILLASTYISDKLEAFINLLLRVKFSDIRYAQRQIQDDF